MNVYNFDSFVGSSIDWGYGPRKIEGTKRTALGLVFLLDAVPGFDRPEIQVSSIVQGPRLGVQDWELAKRR